MIKRIPTNEVTIEITPRNKGDFGFVRMSGMYRTPNEEYRLAEEILEGIKRHVDDVGYTFINQKHVYETEDGSEYETLYEALIDLYAEETPVYYRYEYERPNDKGIGSSGTSKEFSDLVLNAYSYPWNFTVIQATPELTEAQKQFLDKVIKAGLENKLK